MSKQGTRRKMYAVKIAAPNDTSGSPRRGWYVYSPDGVFRSSVDEGSKGDRALYDLFPNAIVLCVVPTTAGTYNANIRDDA